MTGYRLTPWPEGPLERRTVPAASIPPPDGAATFEGLSFAEALRRVGTDAIVREDPYFGRRGIVKKVIRDEKAGFLVAVHIYKRAKNCRGKWEELHNPPSDARKFLAPGRVEIAV